MGTILKYKEKYRLTTTPLHPSQIGFQPEMNCHAHISSFICRAIRKAKRARDKSRTPVYGLFIDLKKAFDSVDHGILMDKLS